MKKNSSVLSALVIIFLLCFNAVGVVSANQGADSALQLVLLRAELESATVEELQSRAHFLQLDTSGNADQLRERLYAWYQVKPAPKKPSINDSTGKLTIQIVSSDRVFVQGSTARFILLEGNTSLSFSENDSESSTIISADRVVVDTRDELVTALGGVHYQQSGTEAANMLEGTILTVRWGEGSLLLSEGEMQLSRDNSEGDTIDFYLTGSDVYFSGTPRTITFNDGFITTNKENAYFSIAAKTMFLIDGGDFFVTNATLSLGRVPMVWVPFLYYPGKTFVFNPVLGFESNRGFFFSSTTDIFGSYPHIMQEEDSSFSALLTTTSTGKRIKDGWVYSEVHPSTVVSPLETWAEKSDSYLSLLFDAYQNLGVFVGLDSVLNFSGKKYHLATFGAVAFLGEQVPILSSIYTIPPMRFAFNADFVVNTRYANLALQLPLYSDPRFMRDYGNRLTSFSLGALIGGETYPSMYKSDVQSYTWKLTSSANLPTTILHPFVESLRIETLSSTITWKAKLATEGAGYTISKIELPSFSGSASGTLLAFKQSNLLSTPLVNEPERALDPAIELDDYGIESPYLPAGKKEVVTRSTITSSSLSLGYDVRQTYNEATTYQGTTSVDSSHYARTAGSVTLKAAIAPSLMQITQKVSPLITRNKTATTTTEQLSFTSSTDASLVPLGLSYGMTTRLYNRSTTALGSSGGWGAWDAKSVSRHQLSWSWVFLLGRGKLVPSVNATLAPLPYGIQPKLAFSQGKYSVSASYRMQEDTAGNFVGDKGTLAFSYTDVDHLVIASTAIYDSKMLQTGSSGLEPLEIASTVVGYIGNSYLKLGEKSVYSFNSKTFTDFQLSASVPWAALSVQGSGVLSDPVLHLLDASVTIDAFKKQWWKNRISLGLDVETSYRHSFWDSSASAFAFKVNLHASIAEFLTLDVALTTVNKGFHRYTSSSEMWADFLRSLDFMGEGRRNTQFTMEAVEVSLIHHMADWDLHCKYEGSVVLSDMEWHWNPVFSVFLKWKAIPEIKVDRQFALDP